MIEYSWMWGPILGGIWGPIRGYLRTCLIIRNPSWSAVESIFYCGIKHCYIFHLCSHAEYDLIHITYHRSYPQFVWNIRSICCTYAVWWNRLSWRIILPRWVLLNMFLFVSLFAIPVWNDTFCALDMWHNATKFSCSYSGVEKGVYCTCVRGDV
jgi:hypothetical protein